MTASPTRHSRTAEASAYGQAARQELDQILAWWYKYAPDFSQGGFFGYISNTNEQDKSADKGIVLHSRVLWTFSEAFLLTGNESYRDIAAMACQFITTHFKDPQYGGVYWTVTPEGEVRDGRKQIYGQAFCIYGLATWYNVCRDEAVLKLAVMLYTLIEKYSRDPVLGGYTEAFARNWSATADMRLSEKDENEKKTMNTHLHVIEAYACLYRVWPDPQLKKDIESLLDIFKQKIIAKETGHLHLFFSEKWESRSPWISFGHDIEAAWLLYECAGIIQHSGYTDEFNSLSLSLASGAAEGWDEDRGGLWYEYNPHTGLWVYEKHSWPQAEAMVGFFHAWQLSGKQEFLDLSLHSFDFIQQHLKDRACGEWFWGLDRNGEVMNREKAGLWKCPYHNSRACMEIIRRTGAVN